MARFPVSEGDIIVLAQNIIAGLDNNVATYPAPPVAFAALKAVLTSFNTLATDAAAAKAAAEAATTLKAAGLEELIDLPAAPVGFESTWDKFSAAQAGNTVNFDDDKLKLLGWAGRRAAAAALAAPGQPRTLEAPKQGDGWVFLDWKDPSTAAPWPPTKSSAANAPPAPGSKSKPPTKAKPPSSTRTAPRIGSIG